MAEFAQTSVGRAPGGHNKVLSQGCGLNNAVVALKTSTVVKAIGSNLHTRYIISRVRP